MDRQNISKHSANSDMGRHKSAALPPTELNDLLLINKLCILAN